MINISVRKGFSTLRIFPPSGRFPEIKWLRLRLIILRPLRHICRHLVEEQQQNSEATWMAKSAQMPTGRPLKSLICVGSMGHHFMVKFCLFLRTEKRGELADRAKITTQTQRWERKKNVEQRLKDTDDVGERFRISNYSSRSREWGKAIFKEIMTENFPEHELDINSHMNEVQKILREIIKEKHETQNNEYTERELESPIMKR